MSGEGADRPGRRHDLWDEDTPAASSGGTATARPRGGRHGSSRRGWPWWVILLAILLVLAMGWR